MRSGQTSQPGRMSSKGEDPKDEGARPKIVPRGGDVQPRLSPSVERPSRQGKSQKPHASGHVCCSAFSGRAWATSRQAPPYECEAPPPKEDKRHPPVPGRHRDRQPCQSSATDATKQERDGRAEAGSPRTALVRSKNDAL